LDEVKLMPGVTTMQSTTNTIEAKERRYLVKTKSDGRLNGTALLKDTWPGSNDVFLQEIKFSYRSRR